MWIRKEIHRRKDGGVTVKPIFICEEKRKPRRKRRDNHRTRKALIRQRRGR